MPGSTGRLTESEIRELPERSQLARRRVFRALSLMRNQGLSLTRAVKRERTSRRTMLKYAGRALEKNDSGEWEAKPWDRIVRVMDVVQPHGKIELPIQDSRTARKITGHRAAVHEFLLEGQSGPLEKYEGVTFQVNGETYSLPTDPGVIRRLGKAGEAVAFEDLYADTA